MSSLKQKLTNKKWLYSFLPFSLYVISGHSMLPTLTPQQLILVNKLAYLFKNPQVGDIVAAQLHKTIIIKRVVKIQSKGYFLIGDNARDSFDSKQFGILDKKQILGKVIPL